MSRKSPPRNLAGYLRTMAANGSLAETVLELRSELNRAAAVPAGTDWWSSMKSSSCDECGDEGVIWRDTSHRETVPCPWCLRESCRAVDPDLAAAVDRLALLPCAEEWDQLRDTFTGDPANESLSYREIMLAAAASLGPYRPPAPPPKRPATCTGCAVEFGPDEESYTRAGRPSCCRCIPAREQPPRLRVAE